MAHHTALPPRVHAAPVHTAPSTPAPGGRGGTPRAPRREETERTFGHQISRIRLRDEGAAEARGALASTRGPGALASRHAYALPGLPGHRLGMPAARALPPSPAPAPAAETGPVVQSRAPIQRLTLTRGEKKATGIGGALATVGGVALGGLALGGAIATSPWWGAGLAVAGLGSLAASWFSKTPETRQAERIDRSTLPDGLREQLRRSHRVVARARDKVRPNDLTPEEHDRVVGLLEQVHAGGTNLGIDTSVAELGAPNEEEGRDTARRLRDATVSDLITITQTSQGRGLLHRVAVADADRDRGNRVVVTPYTQYIAPFAKPRIKHQGSEEEQAEQRRRRQRAEVEYTPSSFRRAKLVEASDEGNRARQVQAEYEQQQVHNPWVVPEHTDVGLFHELVHASHLQRGEVLSPTDYVTAETTRRADPIDLHDQGGRQVSREEYRTVGLGGYENEAFTDRKYRAERRLLGENVPDRPYYTFKDRHGRAML